MAAYLKVKLLYGAIAREQDQKDTLRGLGLRRREQQRILKNTPAIKGMIQKVYDLVKWEEVDSPTLPVRPKIETYRLGEVIARPKKEKKPKVKAVAHEESRKKDAAKTSKKGSEKKPAAKKSAAKKKS